MYRGDVPCHDYSIDTQSSSVRFKPGGDCDVGEGEELRFEYNTACDAP